jgi:hypothetical protein
MRESWDVDSVAARFSEAIETARKLPPVRVQGYTSRWPSLVREEWETLATDDDRPLRFPPSPQAIDRMLETMRWVQWLEDVEVRKLVWMRAKRYAWHQIGKRFGCDRTTAWRRWQAAMHVIVDQLTASAAPRA